MSGTTPLAIGDVFTQLGETAYGAIKTGELNDGSPVNVPFVIKRGRFEGPTLWLQAGVHGDEYVGPASIQRLLEELDTEQMHGTVIAVPIVNILAYRSRTRYTSQDGLDANRSWPGHPLAEAMHFQAHTEMMLHIIFENIRAHADYLVDCHDGSRLARMAPYVAYDTGPEAWQNKCRDLAFASGMAIVWQVSHNFSATTYPGSLRPELAKQGIPGITFEVGGQERADEQDVARMHLALQNVVSHLGIVKGKLRIPEPQIFVDKGVWLRPSLGGMFYPRVKPLDRVQVGQTVAVITDLFGQVREQLVSPIDGVVIGIRTLGNTASGEFAANLGKVAV